MNDRRPERRPTGSRETLPVRSIHWRALGLGRVLGAVAIGACLTATAQVPQPVLRISQTSSNQVLVQITNAVSFANYEIYRTPLLADPVYPFVLHQVGSLGQSNFTLSMGAEFTGFVQAGVGSDWDSDGIPNSSDANPSNPGVGILTITVTSPAQGTIFN